jgi:uroporphyrinogen decarboxylase
MGDKMTEKWTSRKRVETALEHKEPDRVPLDLSITLNAYINLRQHLGLPAEENVDSDRFFEVRPSLDLLDTLGIDMTWVRLRGPRDWTPPPPLEDGSILDAWGIGRKLIQLRDGSYLNEISYSPMADMDPAEINLDDYPWPDPQAPGFTDGLEQEARRLYEETDFALMGRFGGPVMELGTYLRGFQQWLMDLVLYPDFTRDMLNRIADIQIALDDAGIKAAGKYLSVFKVSGEDLGMQDRTLFSYKVWKDLIYPILARRWRAARKALDKYGASHVKIMLHSDGAIRPFIPDFINSDVDILDPIQSACPGMELDGLKSDFGDKLSFHGGVDTQFFLPRGSVEEVEAETKRCIDALGKDGGFVLGPSHFIQPDVPPENVVTMYQTAREYGRYK